MARPSQNVIFAVVGILLVTMATRPVAAENIVGIGAMGASETQGTTFDGSWVPWLANDRGLNFGPGQSYNVAIGGSSSSDLLAAGQHTEVAGLVASGKVNLAFLTVGGLDFPPVATKILTHTLNVPAFVNQVTGNITTAMDTILNAGDTRMIVLSVPDMTLTGGGQRILTTSALRQPTLDVVNAVNTALKEDVLSRGQVFVDFEAAMQAWTNNPLVIGGVTINTHDEGDSPEHLWLNDLHVATVGNAIFANLMLSAINKAYGLDIPLFSDELILQRAGLSSQYVGHQTSNINYQSFVTVPVPEVSPLLLVSFAGAVLFLCRRNTLRRSKMM